MMERQEGRTSDDTLVDAFSKQAGQHAWPMSPEELEVGWQRLRGSLVTGAPQVPRPAPQRARLRPWLLGFASAAAVTALVLVTSQVLVRRAEPVLRYTVENLASSDGNSFTSVLQKDSRMLFSDGSRIALGVRTRLTLEGLNGRGARVRLVDGALEVEVKPRPNNAWSFSAGPFRVQVKGTAFRLEFAAAQGRLNLHMAHGLVEVFAPQGRTVAVAAGESIELLAEPLSQEGEPFAVPERPLSDTSSLPRMDEHPSAAPASDPRAERASPRTAVRRGAGHVPERAEPAEVAEVATPADWSKLIGQGNFSAVVADAESRGLDKTMAEASAGDLSYLADASRYTRRFDLARRVLLAMRARFAGSQPARDASFFLGRLAEAAPDRDRGAITWYETYLRETPRGTYASEALGREMTLLAPNAPAEARKLARQYVERFPRGSQVELARSLLETSPE